MLNSSNNIEEPHNAYPVFVVVRTHQHDVGKFDSRVPLRPCSDQTVGMGFVARSLLPIAVVFVHFFG